MIVATVALLQGHSREILCFGTHVVHMSSGFVSGTSIHQRVPPP